ncbi:MAG: cyclic nucleotide-binding domain-containing protein [Deltaproteobacteria bacterium]|jgi:CRP-like cAMP-binding protein|nr:cyclic nucleotide-binding domain-containing protein [Deltaproteobacteria bacterium]
MLNEARDLGLRDRILAMRSLDSFAPLEDESLALVAEHARLCSFRKGEVVTVEGQRPTALFVVLEGSIRVERLGQEVVVVQRARGVGFLSVLAQDDVGVTSVALEDTVCLEIPAAAFLRAMEEDFSLMRNTLRLSAGQLVRDRGSLPVGPERKLVAAAGEYRERELTMVERIIQLRQGPVFSQCNLDAVIELVRRSREVRFEPGDTIFEVGDPSTFSFGIDYGIVRCSSANGDSVDVGYGFAMGVMDSFAQQPRSYRAVAQTKVVGFRIDSAVFMSVLESYFELAIGLQIGISRQLLDGDREWTSD